MIKREQDWVLKLGTYSHEFSDTESWVGGAPLALSTTTELTLALPAAAGADFHAVPIRSKLCVDAKDSGLVTVFRLPSDIEIFKGAANDDSSGAGADAHFPWKSSISDWAVGNRIRPTTESSGGTDWAVWTNEVFGSRVSNAMYTYPAVILEVDSASAPTYMRILITPHTEIAP